MLRTRTRTPAGDHGRQRNRPTARRHLNASQRAFVALEIEKHEAERAKARRLANLKRGDEKPDVAKVPTRENVRARKKAAKAVGVGERYVQDAKKIARAAPDKAA